MPKCNCAIAFPLSEPLILEERWREFDGNWAPEETGFHTGLHVYERCIGTSLRRSDRLRTCFYCDNYELSYIFEKDQYMREIWLIDLNFPHYFENEEIEMNFPTFWKPNYVLEVRFRHYPECPWPHDEPDKQGGAVIQMPGKLKSSRNISKLRRAA